MVYWATETANSSGRSYFERARDPRKVKPEERVRVPTGVALTTEAVQRAPRSSVEWRYTDIRRWTEFPRGGHFIALQEPELLAADIRSFLRQFRGPGTGVEGQAEGIIPEQTTTRDPGGQSR
jgi:pimeloyl-ACP methyl ester carboxylesterase